MKKGFTLVELLGVIVIISAIALIVLPPIINQLGSSESRVDAATESLVKEAAMLYVDYNQKHFEFGDSEESSIICITIGTLIEENFLESPLKYSDGSLISNDLYIEGELYKQNSKNIKITKECVPQ